MGENPEKLIITQWAQEDRPREKMLLKGLASLSNAELIAILIGSGNKKETAVGLSQRILNSIENNLTALGKLSVSDLVTHFSGIGEAKAITILAALELGRRRKSEEREPLRKIKTSRDLYELFYPLLADLPHEEFWVVLLNPSNCILDRIRIAQGGVSATTVDVKLILRHAVSRLASNIALCHNHPSGITTPSKADCELTRKIVAGAKLMDIGVIDHLIFSDHSYYSFADEALMPHG